MSNWQPIETAPKDGTRVDLWVVGYSNNPQRIIDAWFDSTDGHWWHPSDDDVWPVDDNRYGQPAHVTHWMPMPEPPRDRDGTRSAETACPAPVPQDCQARPEGIAQPLDNPPTLGETNDG